MIDCVLSLLQSGHTGQIYALSRRGLLPRQHQKVKSIDLGNSAPPAGRPLSHILRWLRSRVEAARSEGPDWRSVVDAIRTKVPGLWRSLTAAERSRFLRHLRPWWDAHRHRMAPAAADRITSAIAAGRLTILAGTLLDVSEAGRSRYRVNYRPRGSRDPQSLTVARIVGCTGLPIDPNRTSNPLIRSLLDDGLARVDQLGIGLDLTRSLALVSRSGTPSGRLFAVGPVTRSALWEITAIPDIRIQCARLAATLRDRLLVP
jgi:uncharacterized NAD(P)/FAD-binding protein YdhS